MSKTEYFNGEYYHIYNRGVESRPIFMDEADYFRFLLGMKEFNNAKTIFNLLRYTRTKKTKDCPDPEPIVEFVCYSLMPSHYHFLVRQIKDDGISKFMQKLGTGYTKYFNKRYERTGVLFQGVFQAKHIAKDEYLLHLSRYIHLNALAIIRPKWRDSGIKNPKETCYLLKNYKWHSLPFWLDDKPCLLKLFPDIVLDQFSSNSEYEQFLVEAKLRC